MDEKKNTCSESENPMGDKCRKSNSSIFAKWLKESKSNEKTKYNTLPQAATKSSEEGNHASLFQRLFAYRLDNNPIYKNINKTIYNRLDSLNIAENTPSSTSEDKTDNLMQMKHVLRRHPEAHDVPSTSEPENPESDPSLDFDKDCETLPNLESPAYLHLKSMMDDSLARVQCQMGIVKESEKFILCSMTKYLRNEITVHELTANFQRHVSIMLTAHFENSRTEQEMLKEQIDSHRIQTMHYKELITNLTNQLKDLRNGKSDFDDLNDKIHYSGDQKGKVTELVSHNEDLRKKTKELREYITSLQTALAELTAMVQNLQQRNRKLATDNEYLKTWIERIDNDYTNQMDHMTQLVETNISHDPILALGTLSVELRTLNSTISTGILTDDLHSQKEIQNIICNICETCHDTISKLNKDMVAQGDQNPGLSKGNEESELRRNREILKNTNEKMQSLLKILAEYEKKAKQWELEKEAIEQQYNREKEEHADFLQAISNRIDKLSQENEQLRGELGELKCRSSSMLQTSKGALDHAQEYLNDQHKKIQDLEETVTDITRENNRLTLVAVYNKQLCEQLRNTIMSRDEAIEQLRSGMQQCSQQLSEDNAEKIALCGEVEQLSEEKIALTDIIERLKDQTKRRLRQNESDKKALNEFSTQYKNIVMERDGLLEERVHLLNQVETLKQRAARQKIKCENQVTTCYQLNMKVAELTQAQEKIMKKNVSKTCRTVSVQTIVLPLYITEPNNNVSYPALPVTNMQKVSKQDEKGKHLRCTCATKHGDDTSFGGIQQLCRCESDTPGLNSQRSIIDYVSSTVHSDSKPIRAKTSSVSLEEFRDERNALRAELQYAHGRIKDLQDELNKSNIEKQKLQDQLSSEMRAVSEATEKNIELTTKLKKTQDQLTAQTKLVTEMTEKNSELTCRMKVTQSNNEHLMWELCQKDCRFDELKNEYRKYADKAEADEKKHIADITDQIKLVKARDEEITMLMKDLKQKNQAKADLEAKLVNFEKIQSTCDKLQKQIDFLNCERHKECNKMERQHQCEIEELRKEHYESYNRYIDTVRELTEQQTSGREALEQAQKALDRLEQKHCHLGERMVDCVKLLVDEKMKVCDSKARRKEMTKLTWLLECQIEDVNRHNSALMTECNDARKRLDELMEVQISTNQLLQREQQEHTDTRNRLLCLRTEVQNSQAKLQMTTCEMRLDEAQYPATEFEIYQSRVEQLKTNLYERQSENIKLKTQISDLQNEVLKINFTVSQQKLEILRLRGMIRCKRTSSEDSCVSD